MAGIRQLRLGKQRAAWVEQFKPKAVKGDTLRASARIEGRYVAQWEKLVDTMGREVIREVRALFESPEFAGQPGAAIAQDASIASQARILLSKLSERFTLMFNRAARPMAEAMLAEVDKDAARTLGRSLREASGTVTLPRLDFQTAALKEAITASVAENVGLIRRIPERFLSDVQGAVMRSITSGNGLSDLLPYMEKRYGEDKRHARNVALDQTRKAYTSINSERMKAVGVRKFEWVHTGGSQQPRKYHMDRWPAGLNGGIFSLDDPPVIDERTGERGLPGYAPFCRCTMRPVVSFDD